MSAAKVHVIVINWNGMDHLEACFDSLIATPYDNAAFVLVDNASSDGGVDFVRDRYGDDKRVSILECGENLGWSRGNNVGIENAIESGADYIFLINNDTAIAPDAIPKLVEVAESDKQIGAIAPKMVLFDQPQILNSVGLACSTVGGCWDIGLGRLDAEQWNEPREVVGACGGAAFFRTDAIKAAGLLPDNFGIYLDDLDLCLRIWSKGYRIVSCGDAVIRHKFSATMGASDRARQKYYLNTRNRFRLMARNWPTGIGSMIARHLTIAEARAVGRGILDGDLWKVGVHARAWAGGLQDWRNRGSSALPTRDACPFWPYICESPPFFPGVPLPVDGWYDETTVRGRRVQPISTRAQYNHKGGALRVDIANCYPECGPVVLRLMYDSESLARFDVAMAETGQVQAPEGTIEIETESAFYAEDTGEAADYGGWLSLTPADA